MVLVETAVDVIPGSRRVPWCAHAKDDTTCSQIRSKWSIEKMPLPMAAKASDARSNGEMKPGYKTFLNTTEGLSLLNIPLVMRTMHSWYGDNDE
jgi:hypothetical protein